MSYNQKKNNPMYGKLGSKHPAFKHGKYTKKYYCIDCSKEVSLNARRCKKHANIFFANERTKNRRSFKGKDNPNYGKKHKFSLETCKKMSKARSGKNNPAYKDGKTLVKIHCICCGKLLSKNAYYYGYKRCGSCSRKFYYEVNPVKGRLGTSRAGFNKKIWMRSGWEIKYAKYLDKNKIDWKYKPTIFRLKKTDNITDIYLIK